MFKKPHAPENKTNKKKDSGNVVTESPSKYFWFSNWYIPKGVGVLTQLYIKSATNVITFLMEI